MLLLSRAYLSAVFRLASVTFFLYNRTPPTQIYTLSLHDALPICTLRTFTSRTSRRRCWSCRESSTIACRIRNRYRDRKSTRLNSSHSSISYAVFRLKKKISTIGTENLLVFGLLTSH